MATLHLPSAGTALLLAVVCVACGSLGAPQSTGMIPLQLRTAPTSMPLCRAAGLAPVRIEREEDALTFVYVATGGDRPILEWPPGFTARLVNGTAELVAPTGAVIGREGDILDDLGGGLDSTGGVFRVCSVDGVVY